MRAYWDCLTKPPTFDFIPWLAIVKTIGVDEIVFDVSRGFQAKKFPESVAKHMYENVQQPACEIWGIPFSEGSRKDGDITPGYLSTDVVETYSKYGFLSMPDMPVGEPVGYTVTIRDSIRNKSRNSNRKAWERFADEIGAIVIEDAYKVPITMEKRWRLYANAKMNFFHSNGPMVLCFFSEAPYTAFTPPWADTTWPQGITREYQFPWKNENQSIVWKDDSYQNIINEFKTRRDAGPASETPVIRSHAQAGAL